MPDPLVTTADGRFQRGITHKVRGFLGNTDPLSKEATPVNLKPASASPPRRYSKLGAEDFDEFCALLTKMLGPDGKVDVERMLQSAPGVFCEPGS